jgi:hypothetical protein
MSYDVQLFSVDAPSVAALQRSRSQISVDGPAGVEAEDIPEQVRALLPGIRFLTEFHLEGDAPESALRKLLSIARDAARAARGVVVDQQEATIETPRGVQRLVVARESTAGGLLQLSWFVLDSARLARSLAGELLDLFQRTVPEILPRRYGLSEPPRFALERDGIDHVRRFLNEHLRDGVIWYGHKPCQHVFAAVPDRVGGTPRGFRCGRLTVNLDGSVTSDPAWRTELVRVWLGVSDAIQPFYAEVRSGECPTSSWWWNGVPAGTPAAALLGEPYTGLWPDFAASARASRTGLHYVERFIDPSPDPLARPVPSPPPGIAQPPPPPRVVISGPEDVAAIFTRVDTPYPPVWPFGPPLSKA